jgi:hypothetical protein
MVVNVNPAKHWRFVTGRQSVQYYQRITEGGFAGGINGFQIKQAKRSQPRKDEIEADADLARFGVIWTVWSDQMPKGFEPAWSDKIKELSTGRTYQVQSVGIFALGEKTYKFRLTCLKEPQT